MLLRTSLSFQVEKNVNPKNLHDMNYSPLNGPNVTFSKTWMSSWQLGCQLRCDKLIDPSLPPPPPFHQKTFCLSLKVNIKYQPIHWKVFDSSFLNELFTWWRVSAIFASLKCSGISRHITTYVACSVWSWRRASFKVVSCTWVLVNNTISRAIWYK